MSSPTRRPCTVMSASHSGQCVMGCDSPFEFDYIILTNKNALHPSLREGRRAFYTALVIPPSFVDASRHQPRRVRTYSSPLTGAAGKGLLSREAISSRSSGFLFTAGDHANVPPHARSLEVTGNRYSSLQSFCVIY